MKDEFITKINNREYISKNLYDWVIKNEKHLLPNDFNIDKYNEEVLSKEYLAHKAYFENMYKGIDDNIKLDEDQIKAILADEEYALIVAGAGTGKTTTMTSKVKYLVDHKGVDPEKILVMSYTKKAVEELSERIVDAFNIPAKVSTFHSLGFDYIRSMFPNKKCVVVGNNEKLNIFLKYIKSIFEDKNAIFEIIELFDSLRNHKWVFGKFLKENYEKYHSYDDFFEAYKKMKIAEAKNAGLKPLIKAYTDKNLVSENIRTIKGEYVKSAAEMIIANFLYFNGIDYLYEEVYSELSEDNRSYRPDFTLNLAGQNIYLEYFGLNTSKYNRIKELKREHHKKHKNLYIELDGIQLQNLEIILSMKLKEMGFVFNAKTDEEIYSKILDNNPLSQLYNFKDFIYSCVDKIKESRHRSSYEETIVNYINTLTSQEEKERSLKQFKYINDFYVFYQKKLLGDPEVYYFDYSDMLYYGYLYIDRVSESTTDFEYIIIDEYQDISRNRYELAKRTADKNNAKVFAVGDDWQSIYAFSGSRIEYFYNFEKYFPGAKLFKINKTYRNSQELINYSGTFIMKNENQIKKDLKSDKNTLNPIVFATYNTEGFVYKEDKQIIERDLLKRIILRIHKVNPEHKILILGRTNALVNSLFDDKELKDDLDTKVTFRSYPDIEIEAMTMHKSKGLTFDQVIVIGLNRHFPIDRRGLYWLEDLFDNALYDEDYAFAEERRLFYVALTRTRNHVFLLTNHNRNERSPFLDELYQIVNKED